MPANRLRTPSLPRSRPLHRQPSQGIRRLFLGALGQEGGQLFGVVGGVDGVALQGVSEGAAELQAQQLAQRSPHVMHACRCYKNRPWCSK